MTKNTRALFAALLVLVMVFTAACSGNDADQSGKEPTTPSTTIENETQSTEPTEDEETVPSQPVPDIAGTVVYDKNGIKITSTGFEFSADGFSIPPLTVLTRSKPLPFSSM